MNEKSDLSEIILQSLPTPLFLMDIERRVIRMNQAAEQFTRTPLGKAFMRRGGEVFRCIHSYETPEGCGGAEACVTCPVRLSIAETFSGGKGIHRRPVTVQVVDEETRETTSLHLLLTTNPIYSGTENLAVVIIEDVSELVQLRDIIPICSKCKKIRNEDHYWQSVENYLERKLDVMFSHGLCGDCARDLYPELLKNEPGNAR